MICSMTSPRPPRAALGTLLLLLLAASQTACITRTVREKIFDDGYTEITLRGQRRGGSPVDRGFEHPTAIAPVRVAHILSRIDLRKERGEDKKRQPAIPLETLYAMAEGISNALAKADSSQEVVVQSVRRAKRWGVFDRHYLTSLLCYMEDEFLVIQISRSDWEIPPRRADRLPETHPGEHPLAFRLIVEEGMTHIDQQTVAVQWRNPVFRKATRTRLTPGGKTILLEEVTEDTTEFDALPQVSDQLSPDTLRALADLEDARRSGEISETEYVTRRTEILSADPSAR
jgi:hypothetical protein